MVMRPNRGGCLLNIYNFKFLWKYPLTLTLSHKGARETKGLSSPTEGRGEKWEKVRMKVSFYKTFFQFHNSTVFSRGVLTNSTTQQLPNSTSLKDPRLTVFIG